MRLDQYLTLLKVAPSRSQVVKWIQKGHVRVNGKPAHPSLQIRPEDAIEVFPPETEKSETILPEKIPLDIIYEDKDLLAVNKPAQMVVHPGAGHTGGTLTNALLAHCGKLSTIGGVTRPGLVHRLDKGTSGVMVVAKNDKTHLALSEQFKNHQAKKIYWALVYGKMRLKEGTFKTLIARSKTHRKKYAVDKHHGKEAITHYRVLKEREGLSLIELRLETGRTHQIRVHLTDAGHSVVGDPLYGGHAKKVKALQNEAARRYLESINHTLLHARTLALTHPATGRKMEWTAPLPGDFERAMKLCFE